MVKFGYRARPKANLYGGLQWSLGAGTVSTPFHSSSKNREPQRLLAKVVRLPEPLRLTELANLVVNRLTPQQLYYDYKRIQ